MGHTGSSPLQLYTLTSSTQRCNAWCWIPKAASNSWWKWQMGYKLLPAKLRWALCLLFKGGITRWGTELLLLWQSLRTKPGPRGPSIFQHKTTPRSYLIGNATLQVYMESASEPLPCAPCLQVNEARKALSAFSKCAVKVFGSQFPGGC